MTLSGIGIFLILSFSSCLQAQDSNEGCFEIISDSYAVPLFISQQDYAGAQRAMGDLQSDLRKVSQNTVTFQSTGLPHGDRIVIAGTIGMSPEVDAFVEAGKIDASYLEGEWEAYQIQVVEDPFEGVEEALVIAGSDKRGTIYGIYEISKQMGVSPWHFWADVPVLHKENVSVLPGCKMQDKPKVQYRGIFLNDENPALYGWVNETYGGFNHEFYGDTFELILRLKGNYIWTAMWGKAFYDDDPLNAKTGDEYGVVIGTTHHEPMGRAHVEWDRYGEGDWNYQTNEEFLKEFWKEGIQRLEDYEATITVGMRGDGDMAMSEETNTDLMERIVSDQREIIEEYSQQDPEKELQLWALYKEVQDYYEQGMEVPDDVMLLLADDNWGNLRLLPEPGKADEHPGGWGIYYHFDYVGGPRNYKWLNTNQVSRTWEQMNLGWEHGVDRMWLVNVGDLKPMEYPISFFLDHAWDPEAMTVDKMEEYPAEWATFQFGEKFGQKIGEILTAYTKYNARRKHELLSPETYSLIHFNEAERIVDEYNALLEKTNEIYAQLPEEHKDAYYQLVKFPVEASANLNELYVSAAKNHWYAEQGRAQTNTMAEKVKELFDYDAELADYFHTELANGKWNHMMSQTHIGYTYWQQPEQNNMPEIKTINVPNKAEMGVSVPGSAAWWPASNNEAKLPVFDVFNKQKAYLEIFNRSLQAFDFTISSNKEWVEFSKTKGAIEEHERVWVTIDWAKVPSGNQNAKVTIESSSGESVDVDVQVRNPKDNVKGFFESNGYVSIEAPNYSAKTKGGDAEWVNVPNLGRTLSSMTINPVTAESRTAGSENSPKLEYNVHLNSTGEVKVKVYLSPTLDYYMGNDGFKYGVSFNDEEPQIVNIHDDFDWNREVANNINIKTSTHIVSNAGNHTLKIWMVDPGVVIQKIVIETGDVGQTYLGPPESAKAGK
ncbi:MAG TPA: glycosyl hydrolase [Balneolaceae bacterium]|nr:glycosyl hydrolase [Balneolaceae bacterium]